MKEDNNNWIYNLTVVVIVFVLLFFASGLMNALRSSLLILVLALNVFVLGNIPMVLMFGKLLCSLKLYVVLLVLDIIANIYLYNLTNGNESFLRFVYASLLISGAAFFCVFIFFLFSLIKKK